MHKEERFNSISHLVGAAGAIAGLAVLVVVASRQGGPLKIISFSVYGCTLVMLYVFSALYHSLSGRAKPVFKKLDHNAIYLLIAGTYTPFTLVTLRGPLGWSLFGVIWGLALFGMVIDTLHRNGLRVVPVLIYLLMGWLGLVAAKPLLASLPETGFVCLLTGGIFYTSGLVFYAFGNKVHYFHGLWHIFVLAGSISHYIAVVLYVD